MELSNKKIKEISSCSYSLLLLSNYLTEEPNKKSISDKYCYSIMFGYNLGRTLCLLNQHQFYYSWNFLNEIKTYNLEEAIKIVGHGLNPQMVDNKIEDVLEYGFAVGFIVETMKIKSYWLITINKYIHHGLWHKISKYSKSLISYYLPNIWKNTVDEMRVPNKNNIFLPNINWDGIYINVLAYHQSIYFGLFRKV